MVRRCFKHFAVWPHFVNPAGENYLSHSYTMQGIEPAKVKGVNYWYHSPLRTEKTPSFKVNRKLNKWYDFGEGKGSNLLDLLLLWKGITIPEALRQLRAVEPLPTPPPIPKETSPAIEVLNTFYVSSFYLTDYYRSRRIAREIADQYLREVRYKNGEKIYYALGFKNDAGGYELRSKCRFPRHNNISAKKAHDQLLGACELMSLPR